VFTEFIKTYSLFSFLESYSGKTKFLLDQVLKDQNIPDWKEYLRFYLKLTSGLISPDRKGHLTLTIVEDDKIQETLSFIDRIVVDNSISPDDIDFIQFRIKPIYKLEERKYRILSPLFTCEKIFHGLYFQLNKINNKLRNNNNIYISEDFRGFYCSKFTEEYLFYQIMDRTFPGKYFSQLSGKSIRQGGVKGEPDYYVRDQNVLFLFESKDVLINKNIKQSNDFVEKK